MKEPFIRKQYDSYKAYIDHQKSKLNDGISFLERYSKTYKKMLLHLMDRSTLDFVGMHALCLGARQGTEVEAFIERGACAIGIDVNPGPDNRFVLLGDASDIQFPDHSFDIVYTNAMDHFLRINAVLLEVKRVLKQRGYFMFLIGSPEDAKKDKHGSTYWESVPEVLKYIEERYGFRVVQSGDISVSKWFDQYVLMRLK